MTPRCDAPFGLEPPPWFVQCRAITNHVECFKRAERTITVGCIHEDMAAVPLCRQHHELATEPGGVMDCTPCRHKGHLCIVKIITDKPGADSRDTGTFIVQNNPGFPIPRTRQEEPA